MRRHVQRDVVRVSVLAAADIIAILALAKLFETAWPDGWLSRTIAAADSGLRAWPGAGSMEVVGAYLLGFMIAGTYGAGDRRRDYGRLLAGSALGTVLVYWSGLWTGSPPAILGQGLLAAGVIWGLVSLERMWIDRTVARARGRDRHCAATLFVGSPRETLRARSRPPFAVGGHYRCVGSVDVESPQGEGVRLQIDDFQTLLGKADAEVVVVCGELCDAHFQEVVDSALAAGCQVLSIPLANQLGGIEPSLLWRDGQALVRLTAPSLRGQQMVFKRVIDLVVSLTGLIVLSPVLGLIAATIKVSSPGPMLFTQERVGRGGRRFRILKFRTMVPDAEDRRDDVAAQSMYDDMRLFKVSHDPRITRVGSWLRRLSLDELPQLINVARGDMSLVGPRPPLPSEVALYDRRHYARFDVKPGITGPWQVSGRNDVRDFEAVVRLEADYIRNWSLLRDFAILARTVPAVLRMKGAH